MADDECDIFAESGLKFSNGCCKKNKKWDFFYISGSKPTVDVS